MDISDGEDIENEDDGDDGNDGSNGDDGNDGDDEAATEVSHTCTSYLILLSCRALKLLEMPHMFATTVLMSQICTHIT